MADNELEVYSVGISSLDELVEVFKIDTNVWSALKPEYNSWPTSMRDDNGQPISVINHQTKCTFVRKNPEPVIPSLKPVTLKIPKNAYKRRGKPSRDYQIAVQLPDMQFGFDRDVYTGKLTETYHDRRALDVALQLVEYIRPDVLIYGGDQQDYASFGRWPKQPQFLNTTQAAIIENAYWLKRFKDAANPRKQIMLEGNHDMRVIGDIVKNIPALYGLKAAAEVHLPPIYTMPKLLSLHTLGIDYIPNYPNSEYWLNEDLQAIHGTTAKSKSGATVSELIHNVNHSFITNHIHRREVMSRTVWRYGRRREIWGMCPGCLCRVDGAVPGVKARQNWQQGIGLILYGDGWEEMRVIPINEGRAIYDSTRFSSQVKFKDVDEFVMDGLSAAGVVV